MDEVTKITSKDRILHRTGRDGGGDGGVERSVDESISQTMKEIIEAVLPERVQSGVIEVTETSSQDRNVQRTVEQDSVEVDKTTLAFLNRARLSKFPRSRASRSVSRWSKVSLRSEFLKGSVNSARLSMSPSSQVKMLDVCDHDLAPRPELAAYS